MNPKLFAILLRIKDVERRLKKLNDVAFSEKYKKSKKDLEHEIKYMKAYLILQNPWLAPTQ